EGSGVLLGGPHLQPLVQGRVHVDSGAYRLDPWGLGPDRRRRLGGRVGLPWPHGRGQLVSPFLSLRRVHRAIPPSSCSAAITYGSPGSSWIGFPNAIAYLSRRGIVTSSTSRPASASTARASGPEFAP